MLGVLRAGADGYVRKDAAPETLLAAVRAVAKGKTYIDPAIGRELRRARRERSLTSRETEVLRQLALGLSNKDIAAALAVSEETVKTHVGHVLSKLHVENRAQAIVQALKRGLVSLDELRSRRQLPVASSQLSNFQRAPSSEPRIRRRRVEIEPLTQIAYICL